MLFKKLYYIYLCDERGKHILWRICRGRGTAFQNWFPPSTMLLLGIKFKYSGFMAITFIHRVISHYFKQQIHWAKREVKDLLTQITEKNRGGRWGMSHWPQWDRTQSIFISPRIVPLFLTVCGPLCPSMERFPPCYRRWTQPWQTIEPCFSIQQSQKNMSLTALFGVQIEVSWSIITHMRPYEPFLT